MSAPLPIVHALRHELRLFGRGRTFWIVAILLVITNVSAAWNGARWAAEQRLTIAEVQAEDERAYSEIGAQLDDLARRGDPRPALALAGMAWYIFQPEGAPAPAPHLDPRRAEAASSEWVGARHAVLPPAPLAAIAVGQSDLHPFYTQVTIRTRPALVQSDELENPVNLLSGRFDLAFALAFCWPLLTLPLFYNVISEEREGGTLALVASQPVSLGAILALRLAVRGGIAIVLTMIASIGSLAVFGGLREAGVRELALWIVAVVVTGAFWCGVATLINLARWRSAANATALTACWLACVVIAPALISEVAFVLAPVPSRVELINAIRVAGSLSAADTTALVSSYYEEHPDATPTGQAADVTAIRGLAQQDLVDEGINPILEAYRSDTAKQQRMVDALRFVSPPLVVYDAVTELAGTATARYRRFASQVDGYHRAWRDYFYPMVHARTTLTRAHYENAPRFVFDEEPRSNVALRALGLLGSTGALGAVFLGVGCWRASRGRLLQQ